MMDYGAFRNPAVFLAVIFLIASVSSRPVAADDTFSCLSELSGDLTEISGDHGYGEYDYFALVDGTRMDARTAIYKQQTVSPLINPYPVDLRVRDNGRVCWVGGIIENTNSLDISWQESKQPNNAAFIFMYGNSIIDGIRIHNAHDGIRPSDRYVEGYFNIRNTWVSYNRDDCIEDDFGAGGRIEDSLFDGCYVFISSRSSFLRDYGDTGNTITVRDNLIRLQKMPQPYGHGGEDIDGHGELFKWTTNAPNLILEDNIFLIEDYPATKYGYSSWKANSPRTLSFKGDKLVGCSNNVIVWLGPDEFPGDVPDDPECVTVTTDRSVWDEARDRWLLEHPLVGRITGVDDDQVWHDPNDEDSDANSAPTAGFNWVCSGLSCGFADSSEDTDGLIVSWGWDFGDGTGSIQQSPDHVFPDAGTYTVSVSVTDDHGANSDPAVQLVSVSSEKRRSRKKYSR